MKLYPKKDQTILRSLNIHVLWSIVLALVIVISIYLPTNEFIMTKNINDRVVNIVDMLKSRENDYASELFMNKYFAIDLRSRDIQRLPLMEGTHSISIYSNDGKLYYSTEKNENVTNSLVILDYIKNNEENRKKYLYSYDRFNSKILILYSINLNTN